MAQPPDKIAPSGKPSGKPSGAVAAFLDRARGLPAVKAGAGAAGRLVMAIDATASRQPTWDRACQLQGEMFLATAALGGLAVQLAYFRGFGEFAATPFLTDGAELARRMSGVECRGGQTQIGKVLAHAIGEARRQRVGALVLVGDAVEEPVDPLCQQAGALGLHGTPVFAFHEGADPVAAAAFRQMARASGGAALPFDLRAADALRGLLRAAAVYAAGGRVALARLPGAAAVGIAGQLPAPR